MIIDLRTQAPTSNDESELESLTTEFDEAMSCVDLSAVIATHCERLGSASTNDSVARFVAQSPETRVGFAAIDPMRDDAREELERVIELGFAGIVLSPADQGYRPTHEGAFHVFDRCAKVGKPVLVANPQLRHPGSQLEFASPALLDEVVRDLPELTVVLGDFGRIFLEETLLMVAKHKRVFAEISGAVSRPWTLYTAMIAAHERGALNKLLFGSGYPNESPEAAIERIYTINSMRGGTELPAVPRESLRTLVERDSLACIGITSPSKPAPKREADAPRLAAGAETS